MLWAGRYYSAAPAVSLRQAQDKRQIRRLKEQNRVDPVALGLDLTIQAKQAE